MRLSLHNRMCIASALLSLALICRAAPPTSPEQTLHLYIDAIRSGDVQAAKKCLTIEQFSLSGPVPVETYAVKKHLHYGAELVQEWNHKGIKPPAEIGDIELQVEETVAGRKEIYSYHFRLKDGSWKIYALAAWGAD